MVNRQILEGRWNELKGRIKERWGLSWQITPRRLLELIGDADPGRARRAFEAMMTMVKIDIAAIERAADAVEPVA